MMNSMRRERGSSLVELMVGLGIMVTVVYGVASLMTDMTVMNSRHQIEDLLNQTYVQGVQTAQNAALFSERNPAANTALLTSDDLKKCLSYNPRFTGASNVDCRTFDTVGGGNAAGTLVPPAVADSLNSSYTTRGKCTSDADPLCLVKRTTKYFWVCPNEHYCTGLRLLITSEPLANKSVDSNIKNNVNGAALNGFKTRTGTVFLSGRQLVSKGEISFTCARGAPPDYALYRLDYVNLTDRNGCAGYDPGPDCTAPMYGYAQGPANCLPAQTQGCGDGYSQAGLFGTQDVGITGCGG